MNMEIPPDCLDLMKRMVRLEASGVREISKARRKQASGNGKYISYEYVLWCQDKGWVELTRGPFEGIDWSFFRVTPQGYKAVGRPVPPWT